MADIVVRRVQVRAFRNAGAAFYEPPGGLGPDESLNGKEVRCIVLESVIMDMLYVANGDLIGIGKRAHRGFSYGSCMLLPWTEIGYLRETSEGVGLSMMNKYIGVSLY